MSSVSSTFHIPFPRNFLAVNTPAKQSRPANRPATPNKPEEPTHGFLSNRPASVPRHQSKSSVSSIASVAASDASTTISPPSSPPTTAADSPVLGPKIFAPLAVNTKHALPPQSVTEMSSVAEKSAFLSNRH